MSQWNFLCKIGGPLNSPIFAQWVNILILNWITVLKASSIMTYSFFILEIISYAAVLFVLYAVTPVFDLFNACNES